MNRVMVIGAHSPLARCTIKDFINATNASLTLFCKPPNALARLAPRCVRVIDGFVFNTALLNQALDGQDVVVAYPEGEAEAQAAAIVRSMREMGVRRLIYISWVGVFDDLASERHSAVLEPHLKAAQLVEESELDFTILRPAWTTDSNEIDYVTTPKGEPFKSNIVSRTSVSALIIKLAQAPYSAVGCNLSVSKTWSDMNRSGMY